MSHKDLTYDELKSLGRDEFNALFIQRRIERYGTDDLRKVKDQKLPHIEKTIDRCAQIFKQKRNYFLKLYMSSNSKVLRKQYLHMSNVYSDCLLILNYQDNFSREFCEWCAPYLLKR